MFARKVKNKKRFSVTSSRCETSCSASKTSVFQSRIRVAAIRWEPFAQKAVLAWHAGLTCVSNRLAVTVLIYSHTMQREEPQKTGSAKSERRSPVRSLSVNRKCAVNMHGPACCETSTLIRQTDVKLPLGTFFSSTIT